MSELTAVIALGETVGGDDGGDASGAGEEANRGTHCGHVLWLDSDSDQSGEFPLTGGRIGVEVSGRENADPLGVPNRGRQAVEEFLGVVGKVGKGEGVYCEVGLVRGESER